MCFDIVYSRTPVSLVGGGDCTPEDLRRARALAPKVVAADGGADVLRRANVAPEAVIGDCDSLTSDTRAWLETGILHQIDEQDSTDFDTVMRHVRAPLLLGVGFLGARLDHQLAVLTTLVKRPDRRCLLLGGADIVFVCPPRISLDVDAGTRVSLYPLAPVTGRSKGLHWPIDGLTMSPDTRVGTSNAATGQVHLNVDRPAMLVILPAASFERIVPDLWQCSATWPARA